eukprot:jgi/Ulvmu1/2232/UM013_0079.1
MLPLPAICARLVSIRGSLARLVASRQINLSTSSQGTCCHNGVDLTSLALATSCRYWPQKSAPHERTRKRSRTVAADSSEQQDLPESDVKSIEASGGKAQSDVAASQTFSHLVCPLTKQPLRCEIHFGQAQSQTVCNRV